MQMMKISVLTVNIKQMIQNVNNEAEISYSTDQIGVNE